MLRDVLAKFHSTNRHCHGKDELSRLARPSHREVEVGKIETYVTVPCGGGNLYRSAIKLLLQKIRGSRQELIDPDQLLLFSVEELKKFAEQLNKQGEDLIEDDDDSQPRKRRKPKRRVGKLPEHLERSHVGFKRVVIGIERRIS